MVQFLMENGEIVPVPVDVVSQGGPAMQSFYDNQVARIQAEAAPVSPATPAGA